MSKRQTRPDIARLTLTVTWPAIYERENEDQWGSFTRLIPQIDELVQHAVLEHFDGAIEASPVYYRKGSVELLVLLAGTYAFAKDYKGLRDSIDALVRDVCRLMKRLLQSEMPNARKGANAYDVEGDWAPQSDFPAQTEPFGVPKETAPAFTTSRPSLIQVDLLTLYLVLSNALLIGILAFLAFR